jgi:hypothetical protein
MTLTNQQLETIFIEAMLNKSPTIQTQEATDQRTTFENEIKESRKRGISLELSYEW